MAATGCTVEQRSSGGWLLLLALVLMGLLLFGLLHATQQHGSVAVHISRICSQGNYQAELINPLTGRKGRVCQISDGGWGIAVYEGNELVTAYKNRAKSLADAIKFLSKLGYKP